MWMSKNNENAKTERKLLTILMGTNDFINIMFSQVETINHQPLTIWH